MVSFQALSATMMLSEEDTGTASLRRFLMGYLFTVDVFLETDLIPGSNNIHSQGQKVDIVLDGTLKNLGARHSTLADLRDKQAYNLREDPVNFKLPATHLQAANTSDKILSLDVFLDLVARILAN